MAIEIHDKRNSLFDLGCPNCISGAIGRAKSKKDFLELMGKRLLKMGHRQVGTKFYCGECRVEMEWLIREGPEREKDDTHMVCRAFCDRCGKIAPILRFKNGKQYIEYLRREQGWVIEKEIECRDCHEKRMRKILQLEETN